MSNFGAGDGNVTKGDTKAAGTTSTRHEFTGSLYVSGNIYANEYHVQILSSSIVYASGSHKFGDSSDDLQQMTGALAISGSAWSAPTLYVQSAAPHYVGIGTRSPDHTLTVVGAISASQEISASYYFGDGSALTNLPGGGSGGGISFDGTTANGVATRKNATTASIESNFTFDGSTNTLSVTGDYFLTGTFHHTGTLNLSGALNILGTNDESTPMLVLDDREAAAIIGRAYIGADTHPSVDDYALFAHRDLATTSNFALRQNGADGITDINSPASVTFRVGSATKATLAGTGFLGIGSNFTSPSYQLDVSGSSRLGTLDPGQVEGTGQSSAVLYVTGAVDQSGSTSTFRVSPGTSASFAVYSKPGDPNQGFPPEGLYFSVDTAMGTARLPAGAIINQPRALNFGTGTLVDNPASGKADSSISYNGDKLVISGSANGIQIEGTIKALHISSGSLAGPGSYVGLNGQNQLVLTASSGGSTSPGGDSDGSVQVNSAGSFGGNSNLKYVTSNSNLYLTGAFKHSGTLNLTTHVNSLGTVASLQPDDGLYQFRADFAQNSRFAVTGGVTLTGAVAQGTGPNWSGPDGNILKVEGGGNDNPILYCQASGSASGQGGQGVLVGIGTSSPAVQLDIRWNPDLSSNTAGGDVVSFATGSGFQPGALYYLNDGGGWASASAANTGSGHDQLLGISLGTDAQQDGMLIRGWAEVSNFYLDEFRPGKAVYIASASGPATEGCMSGAAPTAGNSYARIVGYATPNNKIIYFNPGTSWVELS